MKFNWLMTHRGQLSLTVIIMLGFLFYLLINLHSEKAYTDENLIRFHVVAQSNTEEEQELKLKVRDRILKEFGPEFQKAQNPKEARSYIKKNISGMKNVAVEEVRNAGKAYPVEVSWRKNCWFPAKNYGSIVLPAGNYEAVKVVIGEGRGENWWCVLFPPLCFVDISNSIALETGEEVNKEALKVMKGQYYRQDGEKILPQIRLKILDILSNSEHYLAQQFN